MKISVVTVCFNSAATIRHTLDSFFAQDWPDKELVIVDGASTDGTLDIVAGYPKDNVIVRSSPDKGIYDAMNTGLSLYRGDAVGFLNSDDAFHDSRALADISAGLADHDLVHAHLDFVQDHLVKKITRRWRATPAPRGGFSNGWMPAHPTFYVRRTMAEAVGLFDLTYGTAADYEWMLRATSLQGARLGLIDRVLVDMQTGGRSTRNLRSHVRHNLEALRARRAHLGSGRVDYALIAKPLRKIVQFVPGHRK